MSPDPDLALRPAAVSRSGAVKHLVLLSGAFLVLQVASTDYGIGQDESATAVFWCAVGVMLLWFTYRKRSRVARGLAIVSSLVGAAMYALAAIGDARAGLLAVLYLGQALPLLAGPVRRHVHRDVGYW